MKIWTLLTTNLSLEMTCLILIWRVSDQWSSQTWTIALCIILEIHIILTDAGEVILARLKIWLGITCLMPGASLILLMLRINTKHLWLWDGTKIGIFLNRLYQKCWNLLLRYAIVFGTRGIRREQYSPSRLCITRSVYWKCGNTCN